VYRYVDTYSVEYLAGGYFMTQEDQDAALGRMVARYSEAKKRRAALLSEAGALGDLLQKAGSVLNGLSYYTEFF
jgi:hypothetical protein